MDNDHDVDALRDLLSEAEESGDLQYPFDVQLDEVPDA
jgi:hypothetical protein